MDDDSDVRSRAARTLDGMEAIASTIYVAMLSVVAIAVLAALGYLVLNPPASFGSQGEWFYVGVGFLLIIGWVIGQASWLITRRRRARRSSSDLRIPMPKIDVKPSGLSFQWGTPPPTAAKTTQEGMRTWTFEALPVESQTFKLDASQLADAKAARAAGKNWDEIARQVNPDYGRLSAFEQSLYQRALQLAVDNT